MQDFLVSDLIDNPTPRVAVCLCLDISPSMSGRPEWGADPNIKGVPIEELNRGVQLFYRILKEDDVARYSAEVAIVAFSGKAWKVRDFETVVDANPPILQLDDQVGGTSLGAGVALALDMLEQRKELYKRHGVDYYQPWLVVMTDGRPTDYSHVEVGKRVTDLVMSKKLVVFPIGIGGLADLSALKVFSPKRDPAQLAGLKFQEFFEWLGKSVGRVSNSRVGDETVTLPPPNNWMVL